MGYPLGICPSSCLGVTGAMPTLSTGSAKVLSSGGENRSSLSALDGDSLLVSGSTGIGRFLKGSCEADLSAGRLREVLVGETDTPLTVGQFSSKLSAPVNAGGAGEPPVTRASLEPQAGVPPAFPRTRTLVRKSSGTGATDLWVPFMVMILGINWERFFEI